MQPAAATLGAAYAHGLCIWPTSEALPAHVLKGHAGAFTALQADLAALRSWCSSSQHNLLTVIVATPDWQYKTIYELKSLAKTAYVGACGACSCSRNNCSLAVASAIQTNTTV